MISKAEKVVPSDQKELVLALQAARNWTRKQVAEELEVSPHTVNKWMAPPGGSGKTYNVMPRNTRKNILALIASAPPVGFEDAPKRVGAKAAVKPSVAREMRLIDGFRKLPERGKKRVESTVKELLVDAGEGKVG